MKSSQKHGKIIEDMIKSSFYGSSDNSRKHTSEFDIEASFDKALSIPTNIKTCKDGCNPSVCLADARRFWKRNCKHRLLVLPYCQESDIKIFNSVFEFIFNESSLSNLKGNICFEDICDIHNELKEYEYQEARNIAKENISNLLKYKKSIIKLNPKIDSKYQRRLQCSISLCDLVKNIPHVKHDAFFGDIVLPIKIKSSVRKFN